MKLYHAVTLGARSFQKDEHGKIKKGGKRHPTVEDDVTIYPNSTVLGGETVIGARSTIGGNVFSHSKRPARFAGLLRRKTIEDRSETQRQRPPRQTSVIYLDYNATTPLCDEARAAMLPYLDRHFGNPSSVHAAGREARAAIDNARDKLAHFCRRSRTN